MKTSYKSLNGIFLDLAEMWNPPERLTVSAAAAKYRFINQPGAYVGPWENATTPYMVEPMDTFGSRNYTGMIFIGPAQCGKTDGLLVNTLLYSVKIDPMDLMLVSPTQSEARDFSMRRIDRLHRHTPAVGELMLDSKDADNKYDKQYRNGMILSITWPTTSTLAGKPIGRVILTDRDRMEDDIGGDGEPFDLASMRTTTFGSNAMTVAESSPSRPITDPKWVATTPHEAPPAKGIMALYNRGDRRRWYWPCPHCEMYFEGTFKMLVWDKKAGMSNLDAGDTVSMVCPHCGVLIHPDERVEMQLWGVWLKDGQGITSEGAIVGPSPRTLIASFWLRGVAAAFNSWKKLVVKYLDAMDTYARTGSEEALQKFYNTDLAEPYIAQAIQEMRVPEVLKSRAESDTPYGYVPLGVRFLVATIDVQQSKFVVSVFGILPGRPFDTVVVDRFDIRKSQRVDEDGERHWVKPATYSEDWEELIPAVIEKEYELNDGSGRFMRIRLVGCDSGGKAGVTSKAYEFWRSLKERNMHRRFFLTKGDTYPSAPRARITFPDSSRKDMKSAARGDIPLVMFNPTTLKDNLNGRLDCLTPGAGMYRMPDWLPDEFYNELCSETRGEKGWDRPRKEANEQWDLSYYCIGLCVSELLRVESIDWANPPSWAAEWDKNELVRAAKSEIRFAKSNETSYDFAKFAAALA